MPALTVHMLGKLAVYTGQATCPPGLEPRKVQELFCYLLVHRDRPQHRETLAGTLWGEATVTQSRANLRKTLWQLQAALEPCAAAGCPHPLLADGEWLQIHPEVDLWLDVDLLKRAYALVKGQHGEHMTNHAAAAVEEAVKLYHCDLLDGWYQDWCIFERTRLQGIYLTLLDKLMGYCEAHANYENGLAYGDDALRYDQTCEQVHRRIMRLRFLSGDRSAALRQYERCAAVLREELAIEPSDQTTALLTQIRQNSLDAPISPGPASSATSELIEMRSLLRNFQASLAATEAQVRAQLAAVEQLLARRQ